MASESESCSEDEGYTLVHRPRLAIYSPFTVGGETVDTPSSPELVSATVSEDEWSYEAISANENTPLLQDPLLSTPRPAFPTSDPLTDDEWSLI